MQGRSLAIWTFAVTSVALVMVMLDNLVVSTALNVIRQELGATIEQLEAAIDTVIADIIANGITEAELERAKRVYIADYVYESDNQSTLARRYGFGLVVGQTVEQIENWPNEIRKVTLADVKAAAAKYFNSKASVTGFLLPKARKEAAVPEQKDRS